MRSSRSSTQNAVSRYRVCREWVGVLSRIGRLAILLLVYPAPIEQRSWRSFKTLEMIRSRFCEKCCGLLIAMEEFCRGWDATPRLFVDFGFLNKQLHPTEQSWASCAICLGARLADDEVQFGASCGSTSDPQFIQRPRATDSTLAYPTQAQHLSHWIELDRGEFTSPGN